MQGLSEILKSILSTSESIDNFSQSKELYLSEKQSNNLELLSNKILQNSFKSILTIQENNKLSSTIYPGQKESFSSQEGNLAQPPSSLDLSSDGLLSKHSGWLENNASNYNTSSADNATLAQLRCNCPACCLNNGFANGFEPENISVTPQIAINNLAESPQIDGILSSYQWGFSWGNRQLTYSFYEDSVFNGSYYGSEGGVNEVSEGIKTNVRNILNWVESVVNIDFVEVTETNTNTIGRMRFLLSDGPNYAYAYYPYTDSQSSVGGDVHLKPSYDYLGNTNGFQNAAGQHGYMSLIHEIGHTLGLKHPHDGSPTLPGAEDNTTNTVMTYNFTGSSAGTFMPYDIRALQSLYGVANTNAGNTTYEFTRTDQASVNGQLIVFAPTASKQTIWDSGGVDTLDFSQLAANSTGYRFDLNPGGILSSKTAYNGTSYNSDGTSYKTTTSGTAIAYDVLIENLVNSSSNDEIFLNSAVNKIQGYSAGRVVGQDVIWNATSQDTLDLSAYKASAVSKSKSGNDLILGLGSNGSVTLKNHYAGSQANILYDIGTILNDDLPSLSINDFSRNEGSRNRIGRTIGYQFVVNLSNASDQEVTVQYATNENTALAGLDYIAIDNKTLTFNPGETSKIIEVRVYADKLLEPTESFWVNLSNATNATINDGQAQGTIINDDVIATSGSSATTQTAKDILTGFFGNQTLLGQESEVELLQGSNKSDRFILGNSTDFDYTLITDFNLSQGDVIELHGQAEDYQLIDSPDDLPTGIAIVHQMENVDELIAIVQGVNSLSLESNAFSFV